MQDAGDGVREAHQTGCHDGPTPASASDPNTQRSAQVTATGISKLESRRLTAILFGISLLPLFKGSPATEACQLPGSTRHPTVVHNTMGGAQAASHRRNLLTSDTSRQSPSPRSEIRTADAFGKGRHNKDDTSQVLLLILHGNV